MNIQGGFGGTGAVLGCSVLADGTSGLEGWGMGGSGVGAQAARRKNNRGQPRHKTHSVLDEVFRVRKSGAGCPGATLRTGPAIHLHERGRLHLDETFVDATFASAKRRLAVARRAGARVRKSPLSSPVTIYMFASLYFSN